jgi:hypothetical protein
MIVPLSVPVSFTGTGGIGITSSMSGSSASMTTRKVLDIPKQRRIYRATITTDDVLADANRILNSWV